jgi:hypothetical protein
MHGARISKDKGIIFPVSVFPDPAIPTFSIPCLTVTRAKLASHAFIGKFGKVG